MPFRSARPRDPLTRYRRYTTISLMLVTAFFALPPILQSRSPVTFLGWLAAGLVAVLVSRHWDAPAPLRLAIPSVAVVVAAWSLSVFEREPAVGALVAGMVLAYLIPRHGRARAAWTAAGAALIAAPVLALLAAGGDREQTLQVLGWAVVAYAAGLLLVGFNDYAWRLYLDLDEARETAAELAVVQERFRMSADLHDIQGHSLHVLGLKLQLAERLLDDEPDRAREHLDDARQLVRETLANTRGLVYGDRRISLASEVANARELLTAAGIRVTLAGAVPESDGGDELLALLVRESTTNVLRHAHASEVRMEFGDGRVVVENDGAGAPARLSGLARLATRFQQAGGRLTTSAASGRFRSEGILL